MSVSKSRFKYQDYGNQQDDDLWVFSVVSTNCFVNLSTPQIKLSFMWKLLHEPPALNVCTINGD